MQPTIIQAWIDEVPVVSRKRKAANNACVRPVKSCRRALVESSANAARMPARQQRRQMKKTVSPRRDLSMEAIQLRAEEEDDKDELAAQTPTHRSVGLASRHRPDLSAAPAPVFATPQSGRGYASSYVSALGSTSPARTQSGQPASPSRSQSASESSAARSRSSSPVKQLRDLQYVGSGIYHTSLDSRVSRLKVQLGAEGYKLWQAVADHGKLLPYNIQDELAFFEFDADDIERAGLDRADLRELPELKKEYEDIVHIKERSVQCEQEQGHETGWNHAVHTKVLELAIGFSDDNEVGFRSVTSVKIDKPCRPTHSTGLMSSSQIVDYVIFLNDDTTHSAAMRASSLDNRAINHTDYGPLANRPIAISIETKTEGDTKEGGKVQLSLWVTAQIVRIQDLIQLTVPQSAQTLLSSIVFPLILVQNELWELYFARVDQDPGPASWNPNARPSGRITIFKEVNLGKTDDVLEMYRLVKI